MASAASLIGTLGSLPADIKKALTNYTDQWIKQLSFGAPSNVAGSAGNFRGGLVPFTTSATPNGEVSVAHQLERVPRWLLMGLDLQTVNATTPILTVTRVADRNFLYVSSPTTDAAATVYVE